MPQIHTREADRYPYLRLDTGGAIGARLELQRGALSRPAAPGQRSCERITQAVMPAAGGSIVSESAKFALRRINNLREVSGEALEEPLF